MKNSFKKRVGRAALAGATLVGLTATGLAFAAPASAADPTGMVSGPIANATKYLNANGTSFTSYSGDVAALQQGVAKGTIPVWTYPAAGMSGLVTAPDGRCLVGNGSGASTSLAACDNTVIKQIWKGTSAGTFGFGLVNGAGANYYLHLSPVAPAVQIYGAAGENSNLSNGLAATEPAVYGVEALGGYSAVEPTSTTTGASSGSSVVSVKTAGSTLENLRYKATAPAGATFATSGHLNVYSSNGSVFTTILKVPYTDCTVTATTIDCSIPTFTLSPDATNLYFKPTLNLGASMPTGQSNGNVSITDGKATITGTNMLYVSKVAGTAPSIAQPARGATALTGTAQSGYTATVKDSAGNVLGTTTAAANGTWSLPAPANATKVTAYIAPPPASTDRFTYDPAPFAADYVPAASLTSPQPGTGITPESVFTGFGAPGEVVVVSDADGQPLGSAKVGDDGTWAITLDPAPVNGNVDLKVIVTGTDTTLKTLASGSYTMTGSEEPNAYTGPTTGTITPDTVFTGTGTKGETVTITDDQGNVLGTTEIGADGTWSLMLDPAPINGDVNLTVKIGDETVANPKVTMTGSDEAPAYSGPADGETITPDTVFTGTGPKGETVTITDKDGNVLGETTVGDDGQWSLTLDPAPKNGDVNLIVTVGDKKVADTTVTMTGSDEERALTSPAAGDAITPDTEFAGTGNIGDKVEIKDKNGTVLGSAEVGADGTWSTKLSPVPDNGSVDLVIEITGKDNKTETLADNTYEMTESTTKFEILTPNLSETNSIPNGTVFTGKGEPGSTVVITDKDGNTVGNAEVDDQGNWSAPIDGLTEGPNTLTVTYTAPGVDPVSTDLGDIVVVSDDESTPLMDPAIAGGAGLALLAAAGSFLLIRRRRTATQQ